MKKTLTLVSALIIGAACAAPPTNREGAVDTNRNASRVADAGPAVTEADAIAKEKASWEAIKNKDYAAFESMLADDRIEVLSDGVMDKAGTMAGVKPFEPSEFNFSDWRFLPIDKDMFVLVYTVAVRGKYQGKEFPLETARCASAWVNRGGKWLATFHQECPVIPPAPPATKNESTKAASPTASPVAPPTTGPDPIANEKIVWDLIRSKNYDAFGQLLAPNFLEVLPDGIYEREGAIEVAQFDASKVVLSDWKSVNLDEDAALVNYTIKNPVPNFPPQGQRHSSIWVKRDGKWLGQFHMGGTPVRQPPAPSPPKTSPSPSAK
jgi:hypothetical protein